MRKLIEVAGDIAAVAGLLVCLISGGSRVMGQFYLLGYEAMTLLVGGIGLRWRPASPSCTSSVAGNV